MYGFESGRAPLSPKHPPLHSLSHSFIHSLTCLLSLFSAFFQIDLCEFVQFMEMCRKKESKTERRLRGSTVSMNGDVPEKLDSQGNKLQRAKTTLSDEEYYTKYPEKRAQDEAQAEKERRQSRTEELMGSFFGKPKQSPEEMYGAGGPDDDDDDDEDVEIIGSENKGVPTPKGKKSTGDDFVTISNPNGGGAVKAEEEVHPFSPDK